MKEQPLVYVIEDEADIGDLICASLDRYGYNNQLFSTGLTAQKKITAKRPDICIVDLNLPDIDGIELVKIIKTHTIGIIVVSGRDSVMDRILGLELGADDYITKPFEPRELIARVHSLLRRLSTEQPSATTEKSCACFGKWSFYPSSLLLISDTQHKEQLSKAEGEIMSALLKHPYQILSRDQLLGENSFPYDRSIDVRISRLRKKIESNNDETVFIKTVYGAGYMLAANVKWQ